MRLVVTTWNLQGSRGVDVEAVAAHAREQGTDLLLLQEIQRRQALRLTRVLDARSLSWAFKHWPVKIPAEGMAVLGLSRPVRARAVGLTQRFRWWTWRRRILQIALIPGIDGVGRGRTGADASLAVVNVHLTAHRHAIAEREREVDTLLRLPALQGPMVVAGDFNDGPGSSIVQRLAGAGLCDSWVEAHSDRAERGFTNWSGPRIGKPPTRRLDYVWVSPTVRVIDACVPSYGDPGFDRYPSLSDHLPLTVTLEL